MYTKAQSKKGDDIKCRKIDLMTIDSQQHGTTLEYKADNDVN